MPTVVVQNPAKDSEPLRYEGKDRDKLSRNGPQIYSQMSADSRVFSRFSLRIWVSDTIQPPRVIRQMIYDEFEPVKFLRHDLWSFLKVLKPPKQENFFPDTSPESPGD